MRIICKLIVLLVLVAVVGTAQAIPREDEVRDLYRRAASGDKMAVEPCIAKLEEAARLQPDNHLVRVTLGSALTLRSRDTGFGPAKLRVLNDGIAMMNSAVSSSPSDAHVRLIRALTLDALPSLLGHKKTALADFTMLKQIWSQQPDALTPGEVQTLFYNSANASGKNSPTYRADLATAAKYPVDPEIAAKVQSALAH